MAKTIEKVILGVFLVLVLGVGSVLVTAFATNKNIPNFASSILVDDKEELSEKQESAQLGALAKITEEDAKGIAISAVDIGTVGGITDVELENENGNVVYAVEFTKNGVETDVKIDAGNGKVLAIESDLNEADDDNDDLNDE